MDQIATISEEVELKCTGEKFYDVFRNKMALICQMFPVHLPSYKFLQGNGFAHGCIVHWKYNFGSLQQATQRIHMDDVNKTIILEFLGGDLFRDFKMLHVKAQVIDGGSNGINSVKWSVEFVKAKEDVAPPHNYLQFGVKFSKGIEAYLSNKLNLLKTPPLAWCCSNI